MMKKWITFVQITKLCGLMTAIRLVFAKAASRNQVKLPLPGGKGNVICRLNNSDLVIFLGTFLHGDCRLAMTPAPRFILDLGANAGFTAIQLACQFPSSRILMVEPGEDNCRVCAENTREFKDILLERAVVSHKSGWFRITDPTDIAMSQWYEECAEDVRGSLKGVRVNDLLQKYGCDSRPVLVKMDIEEAEKEIFLHDQEWLDCVDVVLVEPHGEGTKEIIEEALFAHGFQVDQLGEKVLGHRNSITVGPAL